MKSCIDITATCKQTARYRKNAGVRAIWIGECMRRNIGKIITRKFKCHLTETSGPLQLAAGHLAGAELATTKQNNSLKTKRPIKFYWRVQTRRNRATVGAFSCSWTNLWLSPKSFKKLPNRKRASTRRSLSTLRRQ